MNKYYLLFICIISIISFSCDFEGNDDNENYVSAKIIYTGPIEVDGCGY